MIIVDLDDTIFETKSINPRFFGTAISILQHYYQENYNEALADQVVSAIWSNPIDVVFEQYHTPAPIVKTFFEALSRIDFEALQIKAFADYPELKQMPRQKMLVTSGYKPLQWAKIKALNIQSDFAAIYIDDPRSRPRLHKLGIFKKIQMAAKKEAADIWVIGDNPDSEILAGKRLGMNTIQRLTAKHQPSDLADYVIESFVELKGLIF